MEQELNKAQDHANVAVLPPLIFFVPLVASIVLRLVVPLVLPVPGFVSMTLAVAFVTFGFGLMGWAIATFRKYSEKPNPRETTHLLVTTGPFRLSRNPMYIAFIFIYFGLTFALNSWWPILFFPFAYWLLYRGVILREEKYMEQKFGEQYLNYKKSTRRWL